MTLPKSARDELARLPVSVVGPPELLRALPALLQSDELAEKALDLLWSMDHIAKESGDCPCCITRLAPADNFEEVHEHRPECGLAELLRSLPPPEPTDAP